MRVQATSGAGVKFANPLKGGKIECYYKGVTSITGPPSGDLEKSVEDEHRKLATCDEEFSTGNYGVTTCPKTEYDLVVRGQAGEVTGTRRCRKEGQVQKDERELRPLEHYGTFRADDGGLAVALGDTVLVGEDLKADKEEEVEEGSSEESDEEEGDGEGWVKKGAKGSVVEINEETGEIAVEFQEGKRWVKKADVNKLHPQPREQDTPVQRLVKQARLTRVEVLVLILYTGPMFVIYNGILRGFGTCGAVPEGVEFGSTEFREALNARTVEDRMAKAGHKFASTLHVLASAVKKLQTVSEAGQGTRVYRGLGGLDVREFLASVGFAEKSFMSTTESLEVALEYSGAKQGGVGTVLAMDLSEADKGASLQLFSQYPGESEMLFNACSYVVSARPCLDVLARAIAQKKPV